MGLRVNTNIASLTAQRNLGAVTSRLQGNFSRLSSGLRIATASDDAAGLGHLRAHALADPLARQAGRNAQDGVSLVQTAEGALQRDQQQPDPHARARDPGRQRHADDRATARRSTPSSRS